MFASQTSLQWEILQDWGSTVRLYGSTRYRSVGELLTNLNKQHCSWVHELERYTSEKEKEVDLQTRSQTGGFGVVDHVDGEGRWSGGEVIGRSCG